MKKPFHILIIEDNPDDRADIRQMLLRGSDVHYRFTEATTGAAGLRACREVGDAAPDLVLLDFYLPDLDGNEMLAELRGDDALTPLPVVVLTGSATISGPEMLRAGAQDYIGKSWVTPESLTHSIENAVERFRLLTERGQVEARLREQEQRQRFALQAAGAGAWDWGIAAGDIVWSPENYVLYDFDPARGAPAYADWEARVHPDDLARTNAMVRDVVEGKAPEFRAEFRVVHRDGRILWLLGLARVQRDASGAAIRLSGINLDITERKRTEQAILRLNAELETRVAERTAKLEELVGELEHFSYTITHDMRAPLRGMQGFSELMGEAMAGGHEQEAQGFLRRIQTSASRMDLLITDALNYSRAVREELTLAPVDVGALLRGMLDSYPEFQRSKAHIEIEGEMPLVLGNEAGLTQCFSNLLGNAVKFVKPGQQPEIRIWSERREDAETRTRGDTEIHLRPVPLPQRRGPSAWVRIWVEDKGVGIPGVFLPRVFKMFSRGNNAYEGTGIGLALVRKTVERMGGKAGVESEEGRGSRFWLELGPGDRREGR